MTPQTHLSLSAYPRPRSRLRPLACHSATGSRTVWRLHHPVDLRTSYIAGLPVERTSYSTAPFARHVRVDHGGPDILVAQLFRVQPWLRTVDACIGASLASWARATGRVPRAKAAFSRLIWRPTETSSMAGRALPSAETRRRGPLGVPDSAGCDCRVTLGAFAERRPRRS